MYTVSRMVKMSCLDNWPVFGLLFLVATYCIFYFADLFGSGLSNTELVYSEEDYGDAFVGLIDETNRTDLPELKVKLKGSWLTVLHGDETREREFTICNGSVALMARSDIAIVSISHDPIRNGMREHVEITSKYMKRYAKKVGADLHIVDSMCAEALAPQKSANALNITLRRATRLYKEVPPAALARMQKLMTGRFLEPYSRVLMVDDTTMFHPGCPDLFHIVPYGHLGTVYERPKANPPYPEDWLETRIRWFCANYLHAKCFGVEGMFNSGLMLFDRSMQKRLFDARYFHKYKYNSGFYDQAYFNAMAAGNHIRIFDLGVSFNQVGSLLKAHEHESLAKTGLVNERVCIPHMTRAISNRVRFARNLEYYYNRMIKSGHTGCKYECGEFGCWVPDGPLPKPTNISVAYVVPLKENEKWHRNKWVISGNKGA